MDSLTAVMGALLKDLKNKVEDRSSGRKSISPRINTTLMVYGQSINEIEYPNSVGVEK